jgi:hypothetical protein
VFIDSNTSEKLTGQIVNAINANNIDCSSVGTDFITGGLCDDLPVATNGGSDTAFGGQAYNVFKDIVLAV